MSDLDQPARDPVDAGDPFNASAPADIILRSSDDVDFFVLKALLSLTSPVFKDMFSLGRENLNEDLGKNGLPIVRLKEDSGTLNGLLLLIYPYNRQPEPSVEVYRKVGEAAQKYLMDETTQKLKMLVMRCDAMKKEPLRVFALGVHLSWVDVTREAAMNALCIPIRDLLKDQHRDLRITNGEVCGDFIAWHLACQDALDSLFSAEQNAAYYASVRYYVCQGLREKLKKTGCPRATVLMNDALLIDAIRSLLSVGSKANAQSLLKDLLTERDSLTAAIEQKVSKVPLKINGTWIIRPDGD